MGIVSFSRTPLLATLMTPLQTQLGLFGPALSGAASTPVKAIRKGKPRKLAMVAGPNGCQTGKKDLLTDTHVNSSPKRSLGHLKIVRQFDPGISPWCAGRMTISGSMDEVCAELDRMAHLEAVSYRN